jgi:hypothetical protein
VLTGSRNERIINPLLGGVIGRRIFRMPLHAHDAMILVFDGFE